jgi:hypothetical protein
VYKKIHGVRFEEEIVDTRASAVSFDRFLPQSHTNKDVSGKLQRMR